MQAQNGMQCPICRVDLVMAERQGVEIDYCPKCRGVWLDRGELDKIVERSGSAAVRQPGGGVDRSSRYDPDDDDDDRQRGRGGRGSFLSDLFNFD